MMPAVFDQFIEKAPLCVMARITLESLFDRKRLDQLFEATAQRQYHRELMFSQIVELMLAVVLRADKSVLAAYRKRAKSLRVSDEAVYQKLRCQELGISEALVKDSAERLTPVIDALGTRQKPLVPGYRTRILDGNHLQASERRIRAGPSRRIGSIAMALEVAIPPTAAARVEFKNARRVASDIVGYPNEE